MTTTDQRDRSYGRAADGMRGRIIHNGQSAW